MFLFYFHCLIMLLLSIKQIYYSALFWQKFEKKYNNELVKGAVSKETKFEYAWCLIRSKYTDDIKKGTVLLGGELIY